MRRNYQGSAANGETSKSYLQVGESSRSSKVGYRRLTLPLRPQRSVLPIDRRNFISDDKLSAALSAQDDEFTRILHEVDEVSNGLKSGALDLQTLSNALRCAVSCAAKQIVLDRELRSLALTDDLTGLHNRRGFLALATQQLKVTRRKGQGLLLCFADVDNLKDINDSYGHREGDMALVRAAQALRRTFRDSDILARVGGDEFAVLALGASCRNQHLILRRLNDNLRHTKADEPRYRLSVSVGVARLDSHGNVSLGDLMAEADQAMYAAKATKTVWRV